MNLIALKSFADSYGEYSPGDKIETATRTYGQRLIVQGFAKADPTAPKLNPLGDAGGSAIRIRGASGLGDAIYLRPIVEHLLIKGRPIEVISDYPQVFEDLPVATHRYDKSRANTIAHYGGGKYRKTTTQFEDMLIAVGIQDKLPFATTRQIKNTFLVECVLEEAAGRRVVLIHGGRIPMGASQQSISMELLPKREAFVAATEKADNCMLVRIGKDDEVYSVPCDLDLYRQTSVSDLLDLAQVCDGVIGQVSFALPLAEIFGKPFLGVWAQAGLQSKNKFISAITPQKVCSRLGTTTRFVIDSWRESDIAEEANAFFVL